jgi:hypothetical protein
VSDEGEMVINIAMARADWAARVRRQAEEMLIIASATADGEMRDELFEFGLRLEDHAHCIAASS